MSKILALLAFVGLASWGSTLRNGALPSAPLTLSFLMVQPSSDSIPAFPSAEGAGATALIACRKLVSDDPSTLKVWKVQTLNATGDGSFKAILADSVSSANFDIILFDTAGTIPPTGAARFRDLNDKGCAYIAGQTAKGGLQLAGSTGIGGVMVGSSHPTGGSSNVVWRYIRARCEITVGKTNQCVGNDHRNSTPTGGDNIWDHMSVTGGNDQLMTNNDNKSDQFLRSTMSYNLYYGVPLHNPVAIFLAAGNPFPLPTPTTTSCDGEGESFFRNVFSTTHHRNPNTGQGAVCLQVLNNYIYNWEQRNTTAEDSTMTDWVRNYVDNTATPASFPVMTQSVMVRVDRRVDNIIECRPGGLAESENCLGIFVEKNLWVSGGTVGSKTVLLDTLADQWQTVCDNDNDNIVANQECDTAGVDSTYFRRYSRLFGTPKFPVTEVAASQVPSLLIGTGTFSLDSINVGANAWLDCNGADWTRLIDKPDSIAISDIFTNFDRALTNTLTDYLGGSIPVFTAAGPRCADADDDGLPDAWESVCGPDATSLAPGGDISGNKYLNIEEYINGTNGDGRTLTWDDNSGNEDGFHVERDSGSGFVLIKTTAPDVTTYFDADARPKDIFRIIAFNVQGESAPSTTATATCN